MKKIIVILCVCLTLVACKTVRIKDTATGTNVVITEDGLIVEGDLKINEHLTVSVEEGEPEKE
jgi:hypothetical protein